MINRMPHTICSSQPLVQCSSQLESSSYMIRYEARVSETNQVDRLQALGACLLVLNSKKESELN